jgi:hypothetical protein
MACFFDETHSLSCRVGVTQSRNERQEQSQKKASRQAGFSVDGRSGDFRGAAKRLVLREFGVCARFHPEGI